MKRIAALLFVFLTVPAPEIRYFHYLRPVLLPVQATGQSCLAIDPAVFAHASSGLTDLRLYQGTSETPFFVRSDVPAVSADQQISVLNPGKSGGQTVFDAEMPEGTYRDLQFAIAGQDFLATVTVSGSQTQSGTAQTKMGTYTIFDLTRQRLGRSTVLHLPESDFRYLHFQIAGPIPPENVTGITVAHVATEQLHSVSITRTTESTLNGKSSVFELTVPAHTPVDRIVFVPGQTPLNFSRDVQIRVSEVNQRPTNDATELTSPVTVSGEILRVHSVQNGHKIDKEQLEIKAPPAEFDGQEKWTITIENGDDVPLQGTAVQLEMLERNLCFDAVAGTTYTLFYGDPALNAPLYDYARLFVPQPNPVAARLGAEEANPAYQPRPDTRPFTEKHPALLWSALVLVIGLLAIVAFRSLKMKPDEH